MITERAFDLAIARWAATLQEADTRLAVCNKETSKAAIEAARELIGLALSDFNYLRTGK